MQRPIRTERKPLAHSISAENIGNHSGEKSQVQDPL